MLIKALADYYDILAAAEKVIPDGFSIQNIHYKIALNFDGSISEIINYQKEEIVNGKLRSTPNDEMMPSRTEKTAIDSNFIEHRPLYLFGLNFSNNELVLDNKAKKSHESVLNSELDNLKDLDSDIVNAYRNFLLNWKPENEINNKHLVGLGKDYPKSYFVFCLASKPEILLHKDKQVLNRWIEINEKRALADKKMIGQCGISGEDGPIAKLHNKIKGLPGGSSMGNLLVCFNNQSDSSYGNEQSYNSNISEKTMKKYTEAFNYLLKGNSHKAKIDDELSIVYWAMSEEEDSALKLMSMLTGDEYGIDSEETNEILKNAMALVKSSALRVEQLSVFKQINENVDFYIIGIKPNSSRIAIKFICKKKYAEIMLNVAKYQLDMQVSEKYKPVELWRIRKELVSPKGKDNLNPALVAKLFEAIIYGNKYPTSLLATVVNRVKTDTDIRISPVRVGLIKACINRNYEKEELEVSLDKENRNQAYLCGRLFAVFEKMQMDASGNSLNRTIKDSYFSSAASRPAAIFPRIIKLGQHHMNKVDREIFYNKLIGDIMTNLNGEFPESLTLPEQGKFIVGYYHQQQDFYKKNDERTKEEK